MSNFSNARWLRGVTVGLCLLSPFALAQSPTAATATPAAPGAMTNADVIKLTKLGFQADVIDAKINQAGKVKFRLEVDDLEKLQAAGVSQDVISTMLKRSSSGGATGGATGMASTSRSAGAASMGGTVAADFKVKLSASGHDDLVLHSVVGTESTTFAYVTTLIHMNYSGVKADVRIQDPRRTFVIRSPENVKGRFYLVSAESDAKNGVRSVKMGNSHLFGAKNLGAPDSDNQIDYDAVAVEGTDTWKLTPKKDLKPGEYGIWTLSRELYDFGVDP